MIEWSDTDLMVRDTVRQFVDKEIRPHLDELETGELSPYPIARKLFSQFGLDVMAAESVKKMLDRERAKQEGRQPNLRKDRKYGRCAGGFGGGAPGVDGRGAGVRDRPGQHRVAEHRVGQPGSGCGDHHEPRDAGPERTLAARPDDAGEDCGVGDHRAGLRLGRVRRHEDLRHARRRGLHPQRPEDVHHQRARRRRPGGVRQTRQG